MSHFKVWIEVDEYDEDGNIVDGVDLSCVAIVPTAAEALAIAVKLEEFALHPNTEA